MPSLNKPQWPRDRVAWLASRSHVPSQLTGSDLLLTSITWHKVKSRSPTSQRGEWMLDEQNQQRLSILLITSWQIDGETVETVTDLIFLGSKITADGDCSHEIKRRLLLKRKVMTNLDSILKSRDITDKGPSSQSYGFSSSCVWMCELDYKESWVLRNWCFWTVVLEKTLESPLDCKETQLVHPKGNQSWIFMGRTDSEDETPIFWPPDEKNRLIWKDPVWDAWPWKISPTLMVEDESGYLTCSGSPGKDFRLRHIWRKDSALELLPPD